MPASPPNPGAQIANKSLQALKHLKVAVALVWQSSRNWTLAGIVILFVQGLLPLASLYLLKLTIDTVSAAIQSPTTAPPLSQTMTLILQLGAVNLASTLLSSLSAIVSEHQSQQTSDHVYDLIHAKSIEIDLEHYESPEYHDIYHRAQQEAPYRPPQIVRGLAQLGQTSLSLVAVSALLLTFHWLIAAALILAVPPGIVACIRHANRMHRLQSRQAQNERKIHYLHWVLTGDLHAKEVRLSNFGDIQLESVMSQSPGNLRTLIDNLDMTLRLEGMWRCLRRTGPTRKFDGILMSIQTPTS